MLSAAGLGVFVFGVLQSSTWGWVKPKNSPITIFGFSLTLFVLAAGGILLWGFVTWQRHREATNRDPLVHLSLARIPPVRSGLIGMFSQNLVLMGIFFVVPLYLQLVLGLSALETGIKMLPISITMFATSAIGSRLSNRFPVRAIVQSGLIVTLAGTLVLLATIKPTLSSAGFAIGMAVLGVGMGLMISQLGNVVQSSVEESGRSEAGGLQYTGQQLGSSLGVALIGSIVLIGLTSTFISNVEHDPRISADVSAQVGVAAGSIRWPYHPLQLHYRWDHRVPLRRMIIRWLILAVVPYSLVPALCLLMTVPAFILLVLTHSANNHVISFVDAEGKPFGLVLSGPSHALSGGMFAAAVALTCGVAVVVWVLGRRADIWLIRRRQPAIAAYLADPTQG